MPDPRLVAPAALDDLLLYRVSRLLGTAGGLVIRLCEGRFGITRREWRVLAVLAELPQGLLSSEVAQRAQLDRARTSRAVGTLVAKGLLSRASQPGDARQVRVAATAEGRAVFAELYPLVREINRELLSPLSPEDAERLDRILDALQRQAQDMVARAEVPKADRRRGGRMRRVL